jgi:hypothetical protein
LKVVKGAVEGPTPSDAADSTEYNDIQGSDIGILDGRFNLDYCDTAAPPIELYHPVFGKFSALAEDTTLDVPPHVIPLTAGFLRHVSGINTKEEFRDLESRQILSEILGVAFERIQYSDGTHSDYSLLHPTKWNINAVPIIVQITGELGQDNFDPSVRASFSYAQFYCQEEVSIGPIQQMTHLIGYSLSAI